MLPLSELPLDPDRLLALSYAPAKSRAAVGALWRLDVALGQVLAGGREPLISRIKLAWWREALEKLDREKAPAEPVLQAVAEHVLPRGVTGALLADMEQGWSALLGSEVLTAEALAAYASARGGGLFRASATLLGSRTERLDSAGEAWALVDLARHSGNEPDANAAVAAARERQLPPRWPSKLRSLGMLAILAARDLEPERAHWEPQGAPRRMARMLRHRLTGR